MFCLTIIFYFSGSPTFKSYHSLMSKFSFSSISLRKCVIECMRRKKKAGIKKFKKIKFSNEEIENKIVRLKSIKELWNKRKKKGT